MTLKSAVLGTALSLLALGFSPLAAAAELRGHWTMAPSKQPGMVMFGISYRDEDGQSQHQSDWPVSSLQGIDLTTSGKHDVKFAVVREAGRMDAEGFMNAGEGAGTFRFTPDSNYVGAMDRLGFDGIDDQMQFGMAIHDVTTEFARVMKAKNLDGLDTHKLIAFRIFNVTTAFIDELRAAGLPATEADKLVAFRVHGVTPAVVRDLGKLGLDLEEDQLVAFRVHGVTPDYVGKVKAAGLGQPDANQLIAMRVHGITPEYIAQMKSRGLKNLTLDRLVELKIHGID
jgi:hypothetical protein